MRAARICLLATTASCAAQGIGTATLDDAAFTPDSVWAFVNSSGTAAAFGDLRPTLQVAMSSHASLTCTLLNDLPDAGPQAYVLSAFPGSDGPTVPATYQIEAPDTTPTLTPPWGMGQLLACSGGAFNSCIEELYTSGTLTIESVDTTVTGSFSITLTDGDGTTSVSGSFQAPICGP